MLSVTLVPWAVQKVRLFCYICQGAKVSTYLVPDTSIFTNEIVMTYANVTTALLHKGKCFFGSLSCKKNRIFGYICQGAKVSIVLDTASTIFTVNYASVNTSLQDKAEWKKTAP